MKHLKSYFVLRRPNNFLFALLSIFFNNLELSKIPSFPNHSPAPPFFFKHIIAVLDLGGEETEIPGWMGGWTDGQTDRQA